MPPVRVVGWTPPSPDGVATPTHTARRPRRSLPPPESPLAALLRTTSFPCLPSLAIRRPKSPGGSGSAGGGGSPLSATPASRASPDCGLSRSSDPVAIPHVRMTVRSDPSLAEELSSVESGQACFPSTPAPKNSVSRAPPPRLARASAHALAGSADGSASLADLQARLDKEGQAGAARLLAELAAAEADRADLASAAAELASAAGLGGRAFLFDDLDAAPAGDVAAA